MSKAHTDFDSASLIRAESKSLYCHCLEFIDSINLDQAERIIAIRLLDELEPTGWITDDLHQVAQELNCDPKALNKVLTKLQDIEPAALSPGICENA